MSKWLSRRLQLDALGRHPALSERATLLALAARFVDELASGIVLVLLPTLRRTAGLGVGGIGLLLQVMDLVGALADPAAGLAVDLWRRRPLLVAGALGWAAALGTIAVAPSLSGLVVAFACIGAASGMLAHTADVVLIDGGRAITSLAPLRCRTEWSGSPGGRRQRRHDGRAGCCQAPSPPAQEPGQLASISRRTWSRSFPRIHSFMPLPKLPAPTCDGKRSDASKRAAPSRTASMMASAEVARISSL